MSIKRKYFWHEPPRHADEVWATAYDMYRNNVTAAEVSISEVSHNKSAVVSKPEMERWIDVGGVHDPSIGCFDHHNGVSDHSAFYLVVKSYNDEVMLASTLMTRVDAWDTLGFVGAAKKLGLRMPADEVEFPFDQIERTMLRKIERKQYEFLDAFVEAIRYHLDAWQLKHSRIQFLRENTDIYEIPIDKTAWGQTLLLGDMLSPRSGETPDMAIKILFLPTSLGKSQIVGLSDVAKENGCHLKMAPNMSDTRRWSIVRTNRGRLHGISLANLTTLNGALFSYAHQGGHLATTQVGFAPKKVFEFLRNVDLGFRPCIVTPGFEEDEDILLEIEDKIVVPAGSELSAEEEDLLRDMAKTAKR